MSEYIGWITGDGTFYSCGSGQHREILDSIPDEKRYSHWMIRMVRNCGGPFALYGGGGPVTRSQREKIFDLCTANGFNFDVVIDSISDFF